MPAEAIPTLALLFFIVGGLYASVGHAGASGYLAVMALLSVPPDLMRPTALVVNVLVAGIATVQFWRAGHFSWSLFWPFAAAATPAAFLGGSLDLPARAIKVAIGVVLVLSAARMAWVGLRPREPGAGHVVRPPSTPIALISGGVLGFVAGVTGTGGGIFLSPLLLMMHWADLKRTAATAALFILVNSLAGLAGQLHSGWRPDPNLAWLATAACVGGLIGSSVGARRASPRALVLLLGVVLAVAGIKLVLA